MMSNGLCIMFAFTCKGFFGCFLQALIKKIKVSGAGRPMKYELRSGMFAHEPKNFYLDKNLNSRRGRVCGNPNCVKCTAVDCGTCRRCLKPSAKNKCIERFSILMIFQCCGSGLFIPDPIFFQPGSLTVL